MFGTHFNLCTTHSLEVLPSNQQYLCKNHFYAGAVFIWSAQFNVIRFLSFCLSLLELTQMESHGMWTFFVMPLRLGFLFICLLNAKCKHNLHINNLYIIISISSWWFFGQPTIRGKNKLHSLSTSILNTNKLILIYMYIIIGACGTHSYLLVTWQNSMDRLNSVHLSIVITPTIRAVNIEQLLASYWMW